MDVLNGNVPVETYKKVKSVLVSQQKPERSPYYELEKKFGLQIDWRPFIHVEPVNVKEFRRLRIRPDEFSSIILTSKNAVDHFFRMCDELRVKMSQETKYFCLTEAVANYLQKFIIYRKRKVFAGHRTIQDLKPYLIKHKDKEKFLLPCSNLGAKEVSSFLEENEFDWQEAMMYQTVSSDLSDLKDIYYDVIVFFSPLEIQALYDNFPDFEQKDTRIAVFGKSTWKAVEEKGLFINIKAPEPDSPSMTMALEKYLITSNKDDL
jgi:uroporphyrinogen-III synthase